MKIQKIEDYYEKYRDLHPKVNNANTLAMDRFVTEKLTNMIKELMETIDKCRPVGESDAAVNEFNNSLNKEKDKLENIYEFSMSYDDVECAYTELKLELDKLEEENESLRKEFNSKPSYNDSKYIIKSVDHGDTSYNMRRYQYDLNIWERKVFYLNSFCKSLDNNIQHYIDYLSSINKLNPTNGKIINVDLRPKPIYNSNLYDKSIWYDDSSSNTYYELEGAELSQFLKDHCIPDESYVRVDSDIYYVNGVPIRIYRVFDTDKSDEKYEFYDFIDGSINYMRKIDPAVLNKIFGGSNNTIVFKQTPRCDNAMSDGNNYGAAGYYNHNIKSVNIFCDGSEYNMEAIVHEIGHAYDFTSRKLEIGDGFISSSYGSTIYNGITYDENGEAIVWRDIIQKEVNQFDEPHANLPALKAFDSNSMLEAYHYCKKNALGVTDYKIYYDDNTKKLLLEMYYDNNNNGVTIGGQGSVYNVHNYVDSPREYFADAFRAYWLSDYENDSDGQGMTKLEYLCPKTYNALNSLFASDREEYYGGKSNE